MKRILLSLAAVAALASCVKENIVAPVEGQLTISAVSADSKTVLDGLNVVWEDTDKIAVVVNAETRVTAEFSIDENTIEGSAADFVGTIGSLKNATSAYAVYPATAAELTHTLPADQTAGVSGLMLSSAALDVDDMKDDAATAKFYPAVSLLQVAVPAGVKSVELTSAGAALVGPATFEVDAEGAIALEPTAEATKTIVLAAETALEAKTYPVVVYPGEVGDLTLKLVGAKGEEFTKTVSNITLAVAEARTINLMQIFQFAPADMEVAANGGTIELPFTTTVEELTVTENADWLESEAVVKGFQTGNVRLVAAANEGDETRTAEVTVSWGEGKSVSFTLTQPAIYRGFLNDADGNPIQWEETFGVYTSESSATAGDNAESTYKNVFTIAISDDFTKGTYKVTNMFKAALYYNNGMITDKGGEYYANYKDGKFVVLSDNAVKSYGFTTDVTLAYDEVNMAFAAEKPIAAYDYSKNRDRFIGGYAAVVKVEEPEVGADPIAGEWDVTVQFAPAFGGDYAEKTGTMVISGSNGNYVIETIAGETYNLAATFSNNVLTASKNGATLTLTYDPDARTLTQDSKEFQTWELPTMKSLVATKQGGDVEPEVDPIAGEWDVTAQFAPAFGGDYAEKSGVMVITGSNGNYVIETIAGETFNLTATFANNTLTASKNGATLTLTYDAAVGTLTQDSKEFQTWELPTMKSLVATKQGGATPEVPVGPSVNIAGTWNQTVAGMSWPAPSATMTITVDGSSVTLTDFVAAGTVVTTTFENNQIVVPKGTAIGAGSNSAGSLDADVVLTLEGNTFTAAAFSIGGWINVSSYSATNPDMEVGGTEPEPEVPADPWWTTEETITYLLPSGASHVALTELNVLVSEDVMNVRVKASKEAFEALAAPAMTVFLFDGDPAGTETYWGFWTTTGTKALKDEHTGTFSNGYELALTVAGADVNPTTSADDTEITWTFAIPRTTTDAYANAEGNVYLSVLLDDGWDQTGALPSRGSSMLKVNLFEVDGVLYETNLPKLDWESAAVVENGESATKDYKMKEIRSFGDDNYLYVRLTTSQGAPLEANYLDVSFCNGEGGENKAWRWTTLGSNVYHKEHKGTIDAAGNLTGISFGSADVICYTVVAAESVTWYLAYPRESVADYVSSTSKIYVSALLWNDWSGYWAIPARDTAMLEVAL